MRVLLVSHISEPTNGWGRYTQDLARALAESGHEVTILSDWLAATGRRPLSDPDTYLGYSLWWLRDRTCVAQAIEALQPDIVHVTVEPYLSAVPLSKISKGRRLFLTVHGTYAYYPKLMPFLPRLWGSWMYTRALKKISAVAPVSHNTRRVYEATLQEYGVKAPNIQVVHNGVWMRDHSLPALSEVEKGDFTILSVGAIKARKGILEIVRGVAELKRTHGISAQYRIVGPVDNLDEYVDKVKNFAQSEGILDQLVFTGAVFGDKLEEELRRAHVLALLPRAAGNSLEGFGLVYLEANAYGVPAIGARGSVSEEAILEGKSGLLCNADDPQDVAVTLSKLRDGAIRPEDAKEWASSHDWGTVVKEYEKLYNM